MANDKVRLQVTFQNDGGVFFQELDALPRSARTERIKSLAYLGFVIEKGVMNGMKITQPNTEISAATVVPAVAAGQDVVVGNVVEFDQSDLEEIGL